MLEIKNLTAGYQNQTIVNDISFSVGEAEIVGIAGESGCGKSTLLKSIVDLPGTGIVVTEGKILFKEKNLLELSKREMRSIRGKDICMIFQKAESAMDPVVKIGKQFYESMRVHNKEVKRQEVYTLTKKILEQLYFEDADRILEAYPFEMSGGMNQRIALAMAMLNSPRVILADEPTSALDVTVQSQVVREMLDLRQNFGTSILIVSHNINVLSSMADKLGVMYGGQMVEFGPKDEVIRHPAHPYTKVLLEAVPQMNGKLPEGITGQPPSFQEIGGGCRFASRCAYRMEQCGRKRPKKRRSADDHWYCCHRKRENFQ